MRWVYAMPVRVLFVSSKSGIVFKPSAGAITERNQSANVVVPYFKSQLHVKDPNRSVSQLIIGLSLEWSTSSYCIQFRDAQN